MYKPKPHDLLVLRSVNDSRSEQEIPSWVFASLTQAPYVVARREQRHDQLVNIGVRGAMREERFAGFVDLENVVQLISPYDLNSVGSVAVERMKGIPALQALEKLEATWNSLTYRWGIGGSVGFELASKLPVSSPSSDLDIIIFAPEPFDHTAAKWMLDSARQCSAKTDVLVETNFCAFALAEFIDAKENAVLLRTADGPKFGQPWEQQMLKA